MSEFYIICIGDPGSRVCTGTTCKHTSATEVAEFLSTYPDEPCVVVYRKQNGADYVERLIKLHRPYVAEDVVKEIEQQIQQV